MAVWEGQGKAGSASRLLDGQRKEVTTGGSESLEGLGSRVQWTIPQLAANPEMLMRMKITGW